MKKMIFVLSVWLVLAGILFLGFQSYTEKSYGLTSSEKLEKIDVTTEEIKNMVSVLSVSDYLRNGYMQADKLNDEIVFKQILLNLTDKDYSEINIRPVKIMCQIKGDLWFTSSDTCKIRVIEPETIKTYEKKLFDIDRDIEIEEISFQGYHCKFSKKYYCHMTYYNNNIKDYSMIDKAFKKKDEIIVYEYYLHIDYNNDEVCKKYYGEEYCKEKKEEIPEIKKDIIKKDGVYYKHTFKKNSLGDYYLYSSDVEV